MVKKIEDRSSISDAGIQIVEILRESLICHDRLECVFGNGPISTFYTHGRAPSDGCNYLNVWPSRIRPALTDTWPEPSGQYVNTCRGLTMTVEYQVLLRRPCAPIGDLGRFSQFPSPEEQEEFAINLAEDARIIWCTLVQSWKDGKLNFFDQDEDLISLGDMYPYGPQGGCSGWDMSLRVGIPACCIGSEC